MRNPHRWTSGNYHYADYGAYLMDVAESALPEMSTSASNHGGARKGAGRPAAFTLETLTALVERSEREGWGYTRAAQEAGVSRSTLKKSLRRLDVAWWR